MKKILLLIIALSLASCLPKKEVIKIKSDYCELYRPSSDKVSNKIKLTAERRQAQIDTKRQAGIALSGEDELILYLSDNVLMNDAIHYCKCDNNYTSEEEIKECINNFYD